MNANSYNCYIYGNLAFSPNYLAIAQSSSYPVIKVIAIKDLSNEDGFVKPNQDKPQDKPILEMGFISDIKYVQLNGTWTLIVCSNSNIFSFSEDGQNMSKMSMNDAAEPIPDQAIMYTGIAAQGNLLYIGDSTGTVTRFEVSSGGQVNKDNIKSRLTVASLPNPVTCLEIQLANLYVGTDNGILH